MMQRLATWGPLAALALLTVAAVAGFGVFGTWPHLMADSPTALAVYANAFTVFARAHVLLSFAVLAVALWRHASLDWLPSLFALYAISLGSELLGTTRGIPFGPYHYTDALGPRWFGHVPQLIPLSWFTMAVPSWILARALLRASGRESAFARIVVAAALLLTWDLALDPAMSAATSYWVWGRTGPYYGMPWLNLLGWFVTGLALMTTLQVLRATEWLRLPTGWTAAFYGVSLALPLGMCMVRGLWLAVGVTLGVLGLLVAATRLRPRDVVAAADAPSMVWR